MEIFHESNREKFLWMGFHSKHGWVILDRLIHPNKANHKTGNHLYFVRCMDWTIYKEEKSNWGEPNYIFVIKFSECATLNTISYFAHKLLIKVNIV